MELKETDEEAPRWAEIAYEAIAPVYDDFTAHHEYDYWLGSLLATLEPHGLSGDRLLDVGCGTGKSFIPMLDRDWRVTACDISPAMVALARRKVGERAELSVADMRALPLLGEFDLVWCLDDAVNYLLSEGELEQALAGMRRNLAPGGLLAFDVNVLSAYRGFFAEEFTVERDGRRLIWRGRASPEMAPGSIAEASFEVEPLEAGAGPGIAPEFHRQRHFPEAQVLAALERAGLDCLGVYGQTSDTDAKLEQPLSELGHSKALYVARSALR